MINTFERPGPIIDGEPTVLGPVRWMDMHGVVHEGYPPPSTDRWQPNANGIYVVSSGKTDAFARRLWAFEQYLQAQRAPAERCENRHTRRARARAARRQ